MILTPEVNDLINKALLALIGGFLAYGLPMIYKVGKTWAEAKIAEARAKVQAIADAEERAKAEAKLRLVEYSFKRLDHIVKNTVDEVQQTHSNQTNLTDAEKKLRLRTAYTRIQNQIPAQTKSVLSDAVNDLDRYLITKIESRRLKQKQVISRSIDDIVEKARARQECK